MLPARAAIASDCSILQAQTTGCGEVSGGGVDVGVGNNVVGGGGGESGGGVGGSGSAEGGVEAPCIATSVELCNEQRLEASAPGPAVTTREIAHLVPGVSVQGMEPRGFMVVGLPTNFYADAQPSTVSTTLLGTPAEVRFTPVSFTWDNGDGSTTTSGSGGATWAALGLDEFSETETSHVFDRAGDYTISLTILYSAEYRIGGGAWRPLAGTVPSTSPPLTASAKAAKTVLVADDCGRRRISPGC
ncbi:hypothetical protein SAMN06296010_1946 [Agreia pratensis]|uniref:PKD domain-containing protein n=2 Tax=Agreia pratensis TaxID=150121 RepID=A0A1X7K0S2_9MICO|nr:hypothetical protein SAMN06296010_1946 [Agreia pratensis]